MPTLYLDFTSLPLTLANHFDRRCCSSFHVRSAFPLTLCGLRTFANDEGSRSFVSAMVATGEREVVGLVRAVDGAFEAHGLPPFYQVRWGGWGARGGAGCAVWGVGGGGRGVARRKILQGDVRVQGAELGGICSACIAGCHDSDAMLSVTRQDQMPCGHPRRGVSDCRPALPPHVPLPLPLSPCAPLRFCAPRHFKRVI